MIANIDPRINTLYAGVSIPVSNNLFNETIAERKYPTRAQRNLAALNAINTTFLATTPKGD